MLRLLLLLITTSLYAQNYRFVYEYKFRPDVIIKDSLVTDYMNLDTDGKESYFYNAAKFEKDSAYAATKDSKVFSEYKNFDRNLTYTVHKIYSPKSIKFYDKFQTANLVIREEKFPVWKIQNEFKKIGEVNCQKAVADYRGRKWEAWFSKDYPVSDGPYKFSGLPGLVVQIQDTELDHQFNLIQIKKTKSNYGFLPKTNKEISEKEFRKLWTDYRFASDEIDNMNINSKEGTVVLQLKDGYTSTIKKDRLTKAKDFDAALSAILSKSKNRIERD
ncbi:GLPGLI family protein [Chryseobacterium caseinilyticum]|uniref:GLPGLI family protein n=1 Tax=Chryseobacterium caseinilyticum TaxID=2771428 RepID=A0ABR8Z910_9FLAO|nr:GLPGLI family protein [Chryseobacterium caseinilyticum]MBD8081720.1 GLPGLI family protein [Chryseobacterium caseinilyticum]